jgi:hypothetical protein
MAYSMGVWLLKKYGRTDHFIYHLTAHPCFLKNHHIATTLVCGLSPSSQAILSTCTTRCL